MEIFQNKNGPRLEKGWEPLHYSTSKRNIGRARVDYNFFVILTNKMLIL